MKSRKIKIIDINVSQWIDSWIALSYNPCLVEYNLSWKHERKPVMWSEFLAFRKDMLLKKQVSGKSKQAPKSPFYYPKRVAFNGDLICYNMLPVYLASQMKSCIFGTATISQFHQKLLRESVNSSLALYQMTRSQPKLGRVYLIFSESNWFSHFHLNFWSRVFSLTSKSPFYTLGFLQSFKQAKLFYDFARTHSLPVGLLIGDSELSSDSGDTQKAYPFDESKIKTHIGSSHGIIGTGLDLPTRKLLFANADVFKPVSAYWYNSTPEEFVKLQTEDLAHSILQNLGRFARFSTEEKDKNFTQETRRVAFILGSQEHPGLQSIIISMLSNLFHNVEIIDLDSYENQYTSTSRPKSEKNINSDEVSVWDIRVTIIEEALKCLTHESDIINLETQFLLNQNQIHLFVISKMRFP